MEGGLPTGVNVHTADQAEGPLSPLAWTRQYKGVPTGRLIVGVKIEVVGSPVVTRDVKALFLEIWTI
jgi:hypothetical protein